MTVKCTEIRGGFDCTVFYRDDDNDSGYGDNAQVSYWYGRIEDAPDEPEHGTWETPSYQESDDFDLACERRHD